MEAYVAFSAGLKLDLMALLSVTSHHVLQIRVYPLQYRSIWRIHGMPQIEGNKVKTLH